MNKDFAQDNDEENKGQNNSAFDDNEDGDNKNDYHMINTYL